MNAKLSMEHADWHTPADVIAAVHAVMGGIDLDPCSTAEANEAVKAEAYFTEDDDGLVEQMGDTLLHRAWNGRVFVNPPGGQTRRFWETLLFNVGIGNTSEAVWIGYSLEQLQSLQGANYMQLADDAKRSPLDFPMCVPKKRLAFVENEVRRESRLAVERVTINNDVQSLMQSLAWCQTDEETRAVTRAIERLRKRQPKERAGSPTHGNYITYMGPKVEQFVGVFSKIGVVRG